MPQSCSPKLLPQSCDSTSLFTKTAPQSHSAKRLPKAAPQSCLKHLCKAAAPKRVCFKPVPQSGSTKLFSQAAPESCSPFLAGRAKGLVLWSLGRSCSFEEQLWGLALERNFGGQLLVATLRSSFRELLWRIALGSRFGEQVWSKAAFRATSLRRCFGEQLWEAAAGNHFGEQLWAAALWSRFEEQLWGAGAALHAFKKLLLWGLALELSFGEQPSAVF